MVNNDKSNRGLVISYKILFDFLYLRPDCVALFAFFFIQLERAVQLALVEAVHRLAAGQIYGFETHLILLKQSASETGTTTTGTTGVRVGETKAVSDQVIAVVNVQTIQKCGAPSVDD